MSDENEKKIVEEPQEDDASKKSQEDKGDDKENNLANLRRKNEALQKDLDAAKAAIAEKAEADRSLEVNADEDKEGEDSPTKVPAKEAKKETPDVLKQVFQRDMKEAVIQWNGDNKVTAEEWQKVKAKVNLKGDETLSEIKSKITEAHQSLPEVRARRDKEIYEKGKKSAMNNFNDEEMDFAVDSGEAEGGETKQAVNIDPEAKTFANKMGLTDDEISKVDTDSNPNEWENGKSPIKKFFHG